MLVAVRPPTLGAPRPAAQSVWLFERTRSCSPGHPLSRPRVRQWRRESLARAAGQRQAGGGLREAPLPQARTTLPVLLAGRLRPALEGLKPALVQAGWVRVHAQSVPRRPARQPVQARPQRSRRVQSARSTRMSIARAAPRRPAPGTRLPSRQPGRDHGHRDDGDCDDAPRPPRLRPPLHRSAPGPDLRSVCPWPCLYLPAGNRFQPGMQAG